MKKIAIKKLPQDVQSTLLRLQRPDDDRFVFFDKLSPLWWLPIGGGAVWLFYLFFATQDYLWEEWMFWIFAAVTVLLLVAAGIAALKLIGSRNAGSKSGYIFTRDECLKVGGGCVEAFSLKEMDALRYLEDPKELEFWVGNTETRIRTSQSRDAMALAQLFDEWRVTAGESVLTGYEKPEYSYSGGANYAVAASVVVICVLLAGGISYGAKRMNASYDDRQTWKRLNAIGTVEEYENYKLRHPNGAFVAEADKEIGDTLVKLKDTYKAKTKKFADPNAVNTFAMVLEEAARRPDRTVYVKLNETWSLDNELVKEMEKKMGVRFDSYDFSVPKFGADYRKNKLFNDLRLAFLSSMGNGAIKFELADNPPENAPLITVNLAIENDLAEMPYFQNYHFESGRRSLTYYPGAKFTFDFNLKGSDPAAIYQVPNTPVVKDLSTGLVDTRDAANYSFDKVYFSAVSESFGKFIEQVFGFSD